MLFMFICSWIIEADTSIEFFNNGSRNPEISKKNGCLQKLLLNLVVINKECLVGLKYSVFYVKVSAGRIMEALSDIYTLLL